MIISLLNKYIIFPLKKLYGIIIYLLKKMYGDFTWNELKKFAFLGLIFAFTIGVYWLLRPLKDAIFCSIVGPRFLPWGKIASLIVIFPAGFLYSKLVDRFSKEKIFYALSLLYGFAALGFYWGLNHPAIGLLNIMACPDRWIGWLFYVFVESFGSLMVVTFWSFTADTTTPESAKKGYPLLALWGQIGGILGPRISSEAEYIGIGNLVLYAAIAILTIIVLVKLFMMVVPKAELIGYHAKGGAEKKSKPGFMEGLFLIGRQPYLLGIFAVICIFEAIVTVFDYQFKTMVYVLTGGKEAMAAYMGHFGMWVNFVALVNLLLGIGNVGRKLGLTVSLVTMPVLVLGAIFAMYGTSFVNSTVALQIAFAVMVVCKGINYALGQPSKEQLYIPTSKDTKYKAKAWIEMFGSRGSKAAGSGINLLQNVIKTAGGFILLTTVISSGLAFLWLFVALYLGRTHKRAVAADQIVC